MTGIPSVLSSSFNIIFRRHIGFQSYLFPLDFRLKFTFLIISMRSAYPSHLILIKQVISLQAERVPVSPFSCIIYYLDPHVAY